MVDAHVGCYVQQKWPDMLSIKPWLLFDSFHIAVSLVTKNGQRFIIERTDHNWSLPTDHNGWPMAIATLNYRYCIQVCLFACNL